MEHIYSLPEIRQVNGEVVGYKKGGGEEYVFTTALVGKCATVVTNATGPPMIIG